MAGMVKGPAIFLNQFAGDAAPFNSFDGMCGWAASLGYKGVQIPTWVDSLIDIGKAAESKTYCDETGRNRESPWPRRSPNLRVMSRPSSSRSTRPMTKRSTHSRPRRFEASRPSGRNGRSSI